MAKVKVKVKVKKAAAKKAAPSRHGLTGQLKEIIASRELTAYAVGQASEVDTAVIARFLSGERDIRMETADKIAAALGLRLVEVAGKKGRAAK